MLLAEGKEEAPPKLSEHGSDGHAGPLLALPPR